MYKHDYDKTLYRLMRILSKLNDGEELSVKELAEEFNVSTRTVQRDFNERLVAFYPIYQEKHKWKMDKDFKLEKTRDVEENIVLNLMENILENSGKIFSKKALHVLDKIKNQEYNPIYAKIILEDISDKMAELKHLESAIKTNSIIDCTYYTTKPNEITLKPLKIVNFEGFWYLVAQDNRNDILKKYYLKNISNVQITEYNFEINDDIETLLENAISIWFTQDNAPFEVTLKADAKIAKYFQRKPLPTQKITKTHKNGDIEFQLKITHEMEIIPIVKYWCPNLQILSPSWINDKILEDFKRYFEKQT